MGKNVSLKSQSLSLLVGNILGLLAQMLTGIILVRVVSKLDFGLYQQFILITSTLVPILRMGLDSSLFYFIPNLVYDKQNNIIFQTFIIKSILGFSFVFLCALGYIDFTWINLGGLNNYKTSVSFFVLFMLLSSLVENIFILDKNLFYNKFYRLIEKIIKFSILIGFVLLLNIKYPIINALVVFSILRFLFLVCYLNKRLFSNISINFELLSEQLIYSIPFAGSIFLSIVSSRADKFIINGYISIEEFAIYSLSFYSIPFISQIFSSIHNVVMPEFSVYGKNNDIKAAADLWKKVITKTSSVAIPSIIFFFIMSDKIIEILFTVQYIEAAKYYRIFLFSILFSMSSYGLVLRGFKKTKFLFYSDLIGVIISLPLSFILIKNFNLYGAVSAALIGIGLPITIKIIFELYFLEISLKKWLDWSSLIKILLISLLGIILPLFCILYITNIYLCFSLSLFLYSIFILIFQVKLNVFIYPDFFNFLKYKFK